MTASFMEAVHSKAVVHGDNGKPQSLMHTVLSFLRVSDVSRVLAVSRDVHAVADTDRLWEHMYNVDYASLVQFLALKGSGGITCGFASVLHRRHLPTTGGRRTSWKQSCRYLQPAVRLCIGRDGIPNTGWNKQSAEEPPVVAVSNKRRSSAPSCRTGALKARQALKARRDGCARQRMVTA